MSQTPSMNAPSSLSLLLPSPVVQPSCHRTRGVCICSMLPHEGSRPIIHSFLPLIVPRQDPPWLTQEGPGYVLGHLVPGAAGLRQVRQLSAQNALELWGQGGR